MDFLGSPATNLSSLLDEYLISILWCLISPKFTKKNLIEYRRPRTNFLFHFGTPWISDSALLGFFLQLSLAIFNYTIT